MVCAVNKIDSNVTGLRFAEELCLKQLPDTGVVWYPLEPNSYSDFGGQITTVARNPINPTRQQKKGVTTDLEASGGFNQDLTQTNLVRLMQGFMFADIREKTKTAPMNSPAIAVTAVTATSKQYSTAAGGFVAGDLILASGFAVAANNGLKTVASIASGQVVVTETVADETPAVTASLSVVGFQFPSADVSIVFTAGSYPRLVSSATNMTTLGLIPGEWVFLGGDLTANSFANNSGFARVNAITSTYVEFDKTDWTPVAETGTGKTVRIFLGDVLKNESDPTLIKRRTYQIERTLGSDTVGVMAEYLVGAVANQFTLNSPQAEKINCDLTFVACDNEQHDGTAGVKTGSRPNVIQSDAYNTTNDYARIKLSTVDPVNAAVAPLFVYATDLTISINNNVSAIKALGVLGALDTSTGTFAASGSLTAYFANIAGVQAVRNNADVTLDICMAKANAGMVMDIPLLTLGNGRLAVEQDKPITLPLDLTGAEGKFGHTLLFQIFNYLPNKAESN